MSCAGYVPPLQTRWLSSHCLDALELAEEVQLGFLAGIAPLGVEESLREMEEQRRAAEVEVWTSVRSTPSPMMPSLRVTDGPTMFGRELETESSSNVGGEPLLGKLDAVALHAREA